MNIKDILKPKSEEEIKSTIDSLSPIDLLIVSSKVGFLIGVKKALERGADIHILNDYALRYASRYGHYDLVEFLLKNGANVHADVEEALWWALEDNNLNIVELLLKNGANFIHNTIHTDNNGAIQWAYEPSKEVTELLKQYI